MESVSVQFNSILTESQLVAALVAAFSTYGEVSSVSVSETVAGTGVWTGALGFTPADAYVADVQAAVNAAFQTFLTATGATVGAESATTTVATAGIDISSIMQTMLTMMMLVMVMKMMNSALVTSIGEGAGKKVSKYSTKAGKYVGKYSAKAGKYVGKKAKRAGEWLRS